MVGEAGSWWPQPLLPPCPRRSPPPHPPPHPQVGSYAGNANKNIVIGDYFGINLREPPYSLGEPRAVYDEQTPDDTRKKHLLLYELAALRGLDYAAMAQRC